MWFFFFDFDRLDLIGSCNTLPAKLFEKQHLPTTNPQNQ
jgi:hypothetical protein